jgi:hypothetical protein
MNRTQIINSLIKKNQYNNYLEIGVRNLKDNFNHIKCANKVGVDPAISAGQYTLPDIGYALKSDEYFAQINKNNKFDIIFIDGWHMEDQVDKDIANSLQLLNTGGTIVMHDCNPPDLRHEAWDLCGTVWRSFYKARKLYDIESCVVDTDYGCGIIQKKNKNKLIKLDDTVIDYAFFQKNHKDILNLITVKDFIKIYLN